MHVIFNKHFRGFTMKILSLLRERGKKFITLLIEDMIHISILEVKMVGFLESKCVEEEMEHRLKAFNRKLNREIL